MQNLPNQGGALLLGNHLSYLDWAVVQLTSPRPIRFVMYEPIYRIWYLNWLFRTMKLIPIRRGRSRAALRTITQAVNKGELVCLFPEGSLTRDGQLQPFRSGFERAAADIQGPIVPFCIQGMWGSLFSKANGRAGQLSRRTVTLTFGEPIYHPIKAWELERVVESLAKG